MLRTEALQDLSETHSHRLVVTLVIVVLVLINTLYVATLAGIEASPTPSSESLAGGRCWWAHLDFTRINIELTIVKKDIEELMNIKGIGEKSFLKLKPMVVVAPQKVERQDDAGRHQ